MSCKKPVETKVVREEERLTTRGWRTFVFGKCPECGSNTSQITSGTPMDKRWYLKQLAKKHTGQDD